MSVNVRVLLFASYADALGASELPMQLEDGARARDALTQIRADPRAAALPSSPLLAVNAEYASGDRALAEGDEIAIIPPVAGG